MENDYYKRYEPFFGSWYIKRFIGKGSYGKVFEVERKDAFGTVYTGALKAITVPTSEDELEDLLANGMDRDSASTYFRNYAEGLNREIALMSRLKGHSNIVSYEDHDIQPHEDGMGWDMLIRMELLTPITIFQKANKPFTRRQVIQLGIDLCRALEVCQKYNIIHRDIKPANIFLSETGDFKLGDFGVARIASATTGASTRAGTVNYMAPEVFRGEKYTSNVDIYSLGLVMYQLLNANRMPLCPPYPQLMTPNQWEQANARRLAGTVLPPPANADGRLAEIVLKACSPNSAERYETPALMRQALEAILYTEQETKDIYPEGDALPLPGTSEKNPPAPHSGTDRETENVWVKMREAGGESAMEETSTETETLTEKVPTEHGPELECEKVLETAADETENKTQFLFKAQEEARRKAEEEARKAEEARRAAEEAARQAEFERREQELALKREEARRKAEATAEAKRKAEENASKVEVPVRHSKKKPARGLKHGWADVVGAVGIGAILLIMGYNFFLGGMFTKKEEPASNESVYTMQTSSGWLSLSAGLKIVDKTSKQPELTVLYGGEPVTTTLGAQLEFEADTTSEAAALEDERLDSLNTLLTALDGSRVSGDVTRIEFKDLEQMAFLYQDRISVLLGTLNELDDKLQMAEYVLLNEDSKGCSPTDTGTLDLRDSNKFYFTQGEPTLPSGYTVLTQSESSKGTKYKAGVYIATAKGRMSDVTVQMTFSDEAITKVYVDAIGEAAQLGRLAAKKLSAEIIQYQSADVDGYTGATCTSDAIKEAASACIAQAEGRGK